MMTNVVESGVVGSSRATSSLHAAGTLRGLLVVSLTISAILLGLVGMHAFSNAVDARGVSTMHSLMMSGQTEPASSERVSSAANTVPADALESTSSRGSSDMGAMNCLLLGMVCVLSSLMAFIVLVLGGRPIRLSFGTQPAARVLRIVASRFAVPTAPSLTVLSISRV